MRASLVLNLLCAGIAAGASGCLVQTVNSVSGDQARYSTVVVTGNPQFDAVNAIFKARCVACHTDFSGRSESEWKSLGYVTAGNANASTLMRKLRGSNTGGAENMPGDGSTLSADELQSFRDWINQLKP